MKRSLLLFCLIVFCLSAQAQWTFSTTTATYAELVNPVSVNNGIIWTETSDFQVPIPFAFNLTGQPHPIINLKAGGGLHFPGLGTKELLVFHTPFGGYWLRDKGTTTSLSAISYEVSGAVGQRIVKFQWKNAGFRPSQPTSDPNDFVNFQIWLFEADNHLEVHFGPHNTSPVTYGNPPGQTAQNQGPSVKLVFNNCTNILGLNGPANQPSHIFYNNCSPNYSFIQGSPASGVVYNFSPAVTGIPEIKAGALKMFPNPVRTSLIVKGFPADLTLKEVTVTTLTGQVVYKQNNPFKGKEILEIPFQGVADGVFLVKLETESGQVIIRKIIRSNN